MSFFRLFCIIIFITKFESNRTTDYNIDMYYLQHENKDRIAQVSIHNVQINTRFVLFMSIATFDD